MVSHSGSQEIMMFSLLHEGANLTLYVISSCVKQRARHLVSDFYVSRYRSTLCRNKQTRVPITDQRGEKALCPLDMLRNLEFHLLVQSRSKNLNR